MTLNSAFEKAYDKHWSSERFIKSGWSNEVLHLYNNHIGPTLGHKKLSSIKITDVREFHKELNYIPTTANRALSVLSKLFNFAREYEYVALNPCEVVSKLPEISRERFASPEELKRIGNCLSRYQEKFPREAALILTIAFTGARPNSIKTADLRQIQRVGDIGVLIFHGKSTARTGKQEKIIVPAEALRLIDAFNIQSFHGVHYRILWEKVRQEAGCADLWLRDLRRTYATIGLSHGVELGQIGELLNHSSVQTTKTYAKLMLGSRVESASTIARQMEQMLFGK